MTHEHLVVRSMASLRLLSASLELVAAGLMWRSGRVHVALTLNAALGLIGPTLFALVSALGLFGMSGQVPWHRLLLVMAGVLLVMLGARR